MNRKIRDALEKFCKENIGVIPSWKELVSLVDDLDKKVMHNFFGNTG